MGAAGGTNADEATNGEVAEPVSTKEAAVDVTVLQRVFAAIAAAVEDQRDALTQLDAQVGDGDLGLTLARGFAAVNDAAQAFEGDDCGAMLSQLGMVMNRAASSTMGTLLAMGMLRAGKSVAGKTRLEVADGATILETAINTMKQVGKADVGDKTILDALAPAHAALAEQAAAGASWRDAWSHASAAAEAGMKQTIDMASKVGRAGWYGEKTRGIPDPGAQACVVMFKAVEDVCQRA